MNSATTIDRRAFKELFEEHYNLICNYLHGQTRDWDLAQEVAQKTFVKLWEKREDIELTSSAKSYLFQSARNTLIDHFRSQKSKTNHTERYSKGQELETTIKSGDDGGAEIAAQISWAVDQLKPRTREIFILSKKEGLTYEEIAEFLGVSKRTVEYNMKNALLKLRDLLKDKVDLTRNG
ncbi:MAG: RNA polymerase sigma-70 factor [Saprospiraceae bacterium]|nr:RNA polymerase sigma-70 factor [Saprospiraceae bacterium]